jgi:hypothetical protein
MILSACVESIILSALPAESMMLSVRNESILISVPLAESMMLSAWHARALPLRTRLRTGGAESISLAAGGAECMMLSAHVESIAESSILLMLTQCCHLIEKPKAHLGFEIIFNL